MYTDQRSSGLSPIGDLPWGSHFCQFYQTSEDLLEILVPYFKAGLEGNELCVWVTARPLRVEEARKALQEAVPDFDRYANNGQLEIIAPSRWGAGKFGTAVISRLDRAISAGFDGLRLACTALPDRKGAKPFAGVDTIDRYHAIAVFTYPRDKYDAIGLMEVVKNHRFALVRNAGRWEVIETSEARIVKDALRRSEEKLHSLFNNMSEGFAYHRIVLDSAGLPCDYVFLQVNEAFERLTGFTDVIGKTATQVIPGIDKDSTDWIDTYGKVALTQEPVQFESYSALLDRTYAVSAFSPHKGYFAVTFSDITEKKRAGDELLRAKIEWERTFDSVPDLIAILDDRHRVVRANQALATRLGRSPEECVGLHCYQVVHGRMSPPPFCPHTQTLADGLGHTVEVSEENLGGHFLVCTTPILDVEGKTTGSVHVAWDITEQKRSEEALRAAHEALRRHAERLEAANKELEDFSYSVSHDLRSPLRAIAGFARMILDESGPSFSPETRRKFGIIQDNAQKMGRLIDDLLGLSRLGRAGLNRTRIDMRALVTEAVSEVRGSERDFACTIGRLPAARGDRAMVRQLLVNLISNAAKFSRGMPEAPVEIGSFEEGNEVVYFIRDHGVGFDMCYYNKLFGVFQRLVSEAEFEGTGVGLAIVERVVQRHGGRVWAESEPGKGATFFFTLPPEEQQ